jgi:hypothetical protein
MIGVGLAEGLIEATDWENYRRIAGVSAAGVGAVSDVAVEVGPRKG